MNELNDTITGMLPTNPIRVETGLSRYPIHRLSKQGDISIDICEKNQHGELKIKWEVDYAKKHGQPGPLAYRLDTLIVNRRIENAPRPVPQVIRLGSWREIYEELSPGRTGNTAAVQNALFQNAFASIKARIRYKAKDGGERSVVIADNRYGVIATGETLPDGRKADAVYIMLHDFYREIIDNAMTRPLDYDYLKGLTPVAQRFYELLSYQMYAAIKHDRPRAKLLYSEFCTYAPQTRYMTFDKVKKQMYKVHIAHRQSGYFSKVDFDATTDSSGKPDWIMLYQPGLKARAEFKAFSKRGLADLVEITPFTPDPLPLLTAPEPSPLQKELISHGISPSNAATFVLERGEEHVRTQIEILAFETARKPGKIKDAAAWLAAAIRNPEGHAKPKGFKSPAQIAQESEAARLKEVAARDKRQEERALATTARGRAELFKKWWEPLSPVDKARIDEMVLTFANKEEIDSINAQTLPKMRQAALNSVRQRYYEQLPGHPLHP